MTDDLKQATKILPLESPAAEAVETARVAWDAAMTRCTEAHRAALADLDQSAAFALQKLIELSDQRAVREPYSDLHAVLAGRMEQRVLTLAEALQKHGVLRIMDAGVAADSVSRASAGLELDPVKPK